MEKNQQWQVKFGGRLRAERERKGLTRLDLANEVETKQNYIAEIERGDRNPSLNTFVKILLALEISADSIIFGVSENEKGERDILISDVMNFFSRKSIEDIKALYEITQIASKYINLSKNKLS